MSWQEDLRQIDSDLAAGKLSKEQYAVKREELLAEASSTGAAAQRPADGPAPKAPAATVPTPKPVPAKDLLTTSRPTTAPSPADERSTDSLPHPPRRPAAKEPATVAIAPVELPPPVPAATQPLARPSAPLPAAPTPTPEKPNGHVSTWLFLGLGLLVVVALIGGGLWWLTSDDGDTNRAADPPPETTTTTAPPTTTTTGKPGLIDRLPELPGVLNRGSGTFTPAEGAERKLYGADEALVLKRNKVQRVTWKGSSRNAGESQMAYVILVAQNANARDTAATATALRELSSGRVSSADGLEGFEQLPTYTKTSKEANTYRVIYTSGNRTVRVGVVQSPGIDEQRLVTELTDLLKQATDELPPDDR